MHVWAFHAGLLPALAAPSGTSPDGLGHNRLGVLHAGQAQLGRHVSQAASGVRARGGRVAWASQVSLAPRAGVQGTAAPGARVQRARHRSPGLHKPARHRHGPAARPASSRQAGQPPSRAAPAPARLMREYARLMRRSPARITLWRRRTTRWAVRSARKRASWRAAAALRVAAGVTVGGSGWVGWCEASANVQRRSGAAQPSTSQAQPQPQHQHPPAPSSPAT